MTAGAVGWVASVCWVVSAGRVSAGSAPQADNSSKGTAKSEENDKYIQILDVLEEIRSEDGCLSLKDLTVNGNDLIKIGFTGRSIGLMLNWLLDQVIEETLPNERSVLLAWAEKVWSEAWPNF